MANFSYIFARGGSKGIPKKNLTQINKKPLLAYSINISQNSKNIDKCFVSTDCEEIKTQALIYGAEVINRPKYLAEDDSSEWDAWQHAIRWTNEKYGEFEKFISLPSTAPLRAKHDVEKCIKVLDKETDVVITITEAHRNPFFNMVIEEEGYLKRVCEPKDTIVRRQDAPLVFDMTTVAYVLRPNFILNNKSIWSGRIKGVRIPKIRSIDIDDKYDLEIAKYLYSKNPKNVS